jgi:hypothetical protein
MKTLSSFVFLTFSFLSMASTIKITSFSRVGSHDNVAELCGKVLEVKQIPTFITVISDPNSSRPASYNTMADENGKFCIMIVTHRGSAHANVMGESGIIKTKSFINDDL